MPALMLIINPGSTSTKAALFEDNKKLAEEVVRHDPAELGKFDNVADQFDYRMEAINSWIDSLKFESSQLKAVVGRGAPLRPLEGGSYEITLQLLDDVIGLALQKVHQVLNGGPVFFTVYRPDARSVAQFDVVIQAGPLILPGDIPIAGQVRKGAAQHIERLVHG